MIHLKDIYIIDINKVKKQLAHAMHVKDRYANHTFLNFSQNGIRDFDYY